MHFIVNYSDLLIRTEKKTSRMKNVSELLFILLKKHYNRIEIRKQRRLLLTYLPCLRD